MHLKNATLKGYFIQTSSTLKMTQSALYFSLEMISTRVVVLNILLYVALPLGADSKGFKKNISYFFPQPSTPFVFDHVVFRES